MFISIIDFVSVTFSERLPSLDKDQKEDSPVTKTPTEGISILFFSHIYITHTFQCHPLAFKHQQDKLLLPNDMLKINFP